MSAKTKQKSPVTKLKGKGVSFAPEPNATANAASGSPKSTATSVSALIVKTRKSLGVTQSVFARLIGVSERSISGWELGKPVNQASMRRVKELGRLADALARSMKKSYISTWLTTPNDALAGISPIEALDRGENARLWQTVFYLGSGAPV